jgi:hypothetical protein
MISRATHLAASLGRSLRLRLAALGVLMLLSGLVGASGWSSWGFA